MKDTEYAYAVSYIKTLENKMLTSADINSLINARDFSEAVKFLSAKGYALSEDVDVICKKETARIWKEVEDCTPTEAPLYILKYKNDFHNLKTVLKAFMTNADWRDLVLSPSTVSPEEIYESVKNADFSRLPDFIKDAAKGAYEIITKEYDGQKTEIYIDKAEQAETERACRKNRFLEEWSTLNAVLGDFSIAFRARGKKVEFIRDAFFPTDKINLEKLAEASASGKDAILSFMTANGYADGAEILKNSPKAFGVWCENKKTEFLKSVKNRFFGFEPIMAFILGKEIELRAVRMILTAHKNNIPKEIIGERIGDLYA